MCLFLAFIIGWIVTSCSWSSKFWTGLKKAHLLVGCIVLLNLHSFYMLWCYLLSTYLLVDIFQRESFKLHFIVCNEVIAKHSLLRPCIWGLKFETREKVGKFVSFSYSISLAPMCLSIIGDKSSRPIALDALGDLMIWSLDGWLDPRVKVKRSLLLEIPRLNTFQYIVM